VPAACSAACNHGDAPAGEPGGGFGGGPGGSGEGADGVAGWSDDKAAGGRKALGDAAETRALAWLQRRGLALV
jgi:hypothetical protein